MPPCCLFFLFFFFNSRWAALESTETQVDVASILQDSLRSSVTVLYSYCNFKSDSELGLVWTFWLLLTFLTNPALRPANPGFPSHFLISRYLCSCRPFRLQSSPGPLLLPSPPLPVPGQGREHGG